MDKIESKSQNGCLFNVLAVAASILICFYTSLILANTLSSVWDIETGGSIFIGESEFISFFLFYPIVTSVLALIVYLLRNKLKAIYRSVLISLLMQFIIALIIIVFFRSL